MGEDFLFGPGTKERKEAVEGGLRGEHVTANALTRIMNNDRFQLLRAGPNLVGRLTVEEAALILGFQKHDIPELVRAGLLKYLGGPSPRGVLVEEGRPKHKPKPSNTVKYLSATEVLAHARDTVWLSRATRLIYEVWGAKNARRTARKLNRPDYLFGRSLAAHV